MEFKDTSLITFTKLLGSRLEDFPNINMLPTDAKLFLEKVQEWIEESSEIEVIPSSISEYAIFIVYTLDKKLEM